MVSFLGSILTSPLKKTRQVMAVMKTSNLLMLLKMWLYWLNTTIKVTFLECPCCWRWFWSESGWMSQWEVCLDRARNEGKAKGNAWLFQVWQIYMLTKKVEYDQQHVGKRLQRRRNMMRKCFLQIHTWSANWFSDSLRLWLVSALWEIRGAKPANLLIILAKIGEDDH